MRTCNCPNQWFWQDLHRSQQRICPTFTWKVCLWLVAILKDVKSASTICFFFSLTAQLPDQDVSGDGQTHLGVAHRLSFWALLYRLRVCNGHYHASWCPLRTQNVHNRTHVWAYPSYFQKDGSGPGQTRKITTNCWYNGLVVVQTPILPWKWAGWPDST